MDWNRIGPPIDVRPLFPIERAELVELLAALEPADWGRATACPGWDVRDVVGHVLCGYLRRLSGTRDGHRAPGPRPGEDLPAFIDRSNEEFVVATRTLSPRVLIDLLDYHGPQLDATWAAVDPPATGRIDVWWAAPGIPAPIWLDIAREYTEFWVHQQQIRDAVGRPGATAPRLMHPVIDTFVRALPYTLRDADAAVGTAVTVDVPGPAGGRWTATRRADGWTLAGDPDPVATEAATRAAAEAAAEVEIDADTLWRLATRGITPARAERLARIRGDGSLAEVALTILSIIR